MQVRPENVTEALEAWDAGHEVETVEMGGLGDAYEMAIQCVAFEVMREIRDNPVLSAINAQVRNNESFPEVFGIIIDDRIQQLDARQDDGTFALGGLSGAQAGAAKALAVNLTRHGWLNARDKVPDRMIFVRKRNPLAMLATERG